MIFFNVCKVPYEGHISEPRSRDMDDFIFETTVGEERGVSEARVASLHFPVLRYYSLFVGRCLVGRWESGGLSAHDLAILRHALYAERTSSLGPIVARRLNMNRSKGTIFGGIYASHLAKHLLGNVAWKTKKIYAHARYIHGDA